MVLFSVIIPHYNSTILLKRLLSSIPMDESIQVIVADDKSTEDLTEVKDLVIARGGLFLHNTTDGKNAGVCRNLGLAQAVGKWLVFADADDYFLDGAFDVLNKYTDSDADIIYFSPTSRYENTEMPAKRHISYQKIVKHYAEAPSDNTEILLRYSFMSPCSKMVRNQLVQENQILFDEVPAANDVMFSMRTAYSANKISASMEEIYCISSAKSTLTTKRCKQNYWARVEVFVDRYHFVQDNLNSDKYVLVLPTGLAIIRQAIRQKYDFIFICQIYVFLMKNHVKIFSLKKNLALWKCSKIDKKEQFTRGSQR